MVEPPTAIHNFGVQTAQHLAELAADQAQSANYSAEVASTPTYRSLVGQSMARSGPKAGQVAITLANLIPLVDVGADLMEASIVYRSLNAAGDVNYVGITNNLARRAAEQLAGRGLQIEKMMGGLSRSDARSVEQALIEIHGLGKNGGSLLNKINSIAVRNPAYATQLSRGYDLLRTIGY
jgi:hypothetical protein